MYTILIASYIYLLCITPACFIYTSCLFDSSFSNIWQIDIFGNCYIYLPYLPVTIFTYIHVVLEINLGLTNFVPEMREFQCYIFKNSIIEDYFPFHLRVFLVTLCIPCNSYICDTVKSTKENAIFQLIKHC